MFDAKILLRAVVAVAGCYCVVGAATMFAPFATIGWWALLLLGVLAFYVVLAL